MLPTELNSVGLVNIDGHGSEFLSDLCYGRVSSSPPNITTKQHSQTSATQQIVVQRWQTAQNIWSSDKHVTARQITAKCMAVIGCMCKYMTSGHPIFGHCELLQIWDFVACMPV